jgi:ribosome-binding ATPase YchF (GTP1/OBG family)
MFSLRSFSFLTLRPELVVINLGESSPTVTDAFEGLSDFPLPVIGISCQIEAEMTRLKPAEQGEFLTSMGIEEPAFERIIRTAFSLLGRISYFTVGEDEVKAWVIPSGSRAPQAAAAIHKDFERGFIKAEVVSYEDFVGCGNSLAGAKAAGRLRLEGKDYVVKDGDIISFRFNV